MSAPPFQLVFSAEARKTIKALKARDAVRYKKVLRTMKHLREAGPSYPGLHSHKYASLSGPRGEDVWESYVENRTPSAWRIFWIYGPRSDELTIVSISAHP